MNYYIYEITNNINGKKYYVSGAGADALGYAKPLTGVMYYMGIITGSGTLPVITWLKLLRIYILPGVLSLIAV